ISWFNLSLIPLAIYAAILLTRYRTWQEREFWQRGGLVIAVASVFLMPFMVPYVLASRLYHFTRSIEEIKFHSALPIHWLAVERRNQLWRGLGDGIPDSWKFKLFPGLLPILFSLAALPLSHELEKRTSVDLSAVSAIRQRWARRLDVVIVILIALTVPVIGFEGTPFFHKLFYHRNSEYVLSLLTITIITRLCLAYPKFLSTKHASLIETIRSERRGDCFWLGSLLTVIGFCYSLGWNFFFYRICYDLILTFRSMRVVSRGSVFTYLGLALLSGIRVRHLATVLSSRFPRLPKGL